MSQRYFSRRELLTRVGGGIAGLALTDLLRGATPVPSIGGNPLAPRQPHFPAKAKAVISIFCYGGVSQVDTFDPKPELARRAGEAMTGKGEVVVSQGHPPRGRSKNTGNAAWTSANCSPTSPRWPMI
jgi:hypothetical protein